MALFEIGFPYGVKRYYSNYPNQVFSSDFKRWLLQKEEPCKPHLTVRIIIGDKCNFSCGYCSQQENTENKKETLSIRSLVSMILHRYDKEEIKQIQFWGGEALLQVEKIRAYIREFKKNGGDYTYVFSTNGSLLSDINVQKLLMEEKTKLLISWDGPGQKVRGKDPFEHTPIISFIERYMESGKSAFLCPIFNKENDDVLAYAKKVEEVFTNKYLRPVIWGITSIYPVNDEAAKYMMEDEEQLIAYSKSIKEYTLKSESEHAQKMSAKRLYLDNSASCTENKYCVAFGGSNIHAITEQGEIIFCSNMLGRDENVKGSLFHRQENNPYQVFDKLNYRFITKCNKCLIYAMCQGGCPEVKDEYLDSYCKARFADLYPYYELFFSSLIDEEDIDFEVRML